MMDTKRRVYIRWMIRRDMPEVLDIEQRSFQFPLSEDDFINVLRQRNCIGMIAEHRKKVVGFMVYELHKSRLHLLNVAVDEWYRRCGVGAAMVNKLYRKLSAERRTRILCEIRESNLDAQLFFKAMGFRCVGVLQDFYHDSDEDAYLMQADYRQPAPSAGPS